MSFLYTIPTFQNPSGRTIGTERRRRLVEIAAAHDLPILEDDPYGRVRYDGEPLPSIHELEGGERVTFTSSFSKTVAPGLRIGYFVVPQALVSSYDDQAVSTYISPSLLPQATVFELIDRGAFEPNLDRVRGLLKARKDAMLAALAAEMPEGTRWSSPEGGYFLWLDFDESVDAAALLTRATEAGVTFVRGSDFFPGASAGRSSARLAFSYESPERIAEGVAILASLLYALPAWTSLRRDRPRRESPSRASTRGERFYGQALELLGFEGEPADGGWYRRMDGFRDRRGDRRPDPRRVASTSASQPSRRRRWTPGGRRSPLPATRATASPARGPRTGRTTTAPSSSTPRATASRPCTTARAGSPG